MSLGPPRMCVACGISRAAWTSPRVDYCYTCLPGGPFTPPACGCGSAAYFCQGLCERCHPGAPLYLGSCRDCLAWGVLRQHNWRCWSCRSWARKFAPGRCPGCARTVPLGDTGACRLCYQQAFHFRDPGAALDIKNATKWGQQLYLANMHLARGLTRPSARRSQPYQPVARPSVFRPIELVQLTLFETDRDISSFTADAPQIPAMRAYLDQVIADHASRHGWSVAHINNVKRALKILQSLQDTPGARIAASQVHVISQKGLPVESTLEVLTAADLLDDDRVPAVRRYFTERMAGLPATITEQLELWYSIMIEGSPRPPRRLPRQHVTIHHHIRQLAPLAHLWAEQGHAGLGEITTADIHTALNASTDRANLIQALRGLFAILKGRKKVFTDPMKHIHTGPGVSNTPMPLETEAVRAALQHPNPAAALAVALVVFHALGARQVRDLLLTDIRDGRLNTAHGSLILAGPVRVRLAAYLEYRAETWPGTTNPHLLINRRSAPRLNAVGPNYPWINIDLRPQALREDRILHEIHATGGDTRRICDLFGLSIDTATRYTRTIEHPDLLDDDDESS